MLNPDLQALSSCLAIRSNLFLCRNQADAAFTDQRGWGEVQRLPLKHPAPPLAEMELQALHVCGQACERDVVPHALRAAACWGVFSPWKMTNPVALQRERTWQSMRSRAGLPCGGAGRGEQGADRDPMQFGQEQWAALPREGRAPALMPAGDQGRPLCSAPVRPHADTMSGLGPPTGETSTNRRG